MVVYTCPKCGATLQQVTYTTDPPINESRCRSCGWEHRETEKVVRIRFHEGLKKKHNIDILREMTEEELADQIYFELAQFPDRASLLDWLRKEVGT